MQGRIPHARVPSTISGEQPPPTLPESLADYLRGTELDAEEIAIVICTVDDNGFAHPSLLSRGEVLAVDPRSLRVAVATASRTAQNARRDGRLTLILVYAGIAYYLKGNAHELARAMRVDAAMAKWHVEIAEVRADRPDPRFELGAQLIAGITFVNPPERQARARLVLAELRE